MSTFIETRCHGNGKFTPAQSDYIAKSLRADYRNSLIASKTDLLERMVKHAQHFCTIGNGKKVEKISKTIAYEFLKRYELPTPSKRNMIAHLEEEKEEAGLEEEVLNSNTDPETTQYSFDDIFDSINISNAQFCALSQMTPAVSQQPQGFINFNAPEFWQFTESDAGSTEQSFENQFGSN